MVRSCMHGGARGLSVLASILWAAAGAQALAGQPQQHRASAPAPRSPSGGMGGARAGGGAHLPGSMAGGGAHIPGSMGGGAHMPSSMAGGAHMPSSMAGGAHMPSSMAGGGAHVPGSMGGGAHTPTSVARNGGTHATSGEREAQRDGGGRSVEAHAGSAHTTGASREAARHDATHNDAAHHEAGAHDAGKLAERGSDHHDPRIGGGAAMHTRGVAAGAAVGAGAAMAAREGGHGEGGHGEGGHGEGGHGEAGRGEERHEARELPHRDEHRDVAHDHEVVALHAHDFSARLVANFSVGEFGRWRGGAWANEWHYGRLGWWWNVGDVWYPYADPVFPYPLVVAPLVAYDTDVVEGYDTALRTLPPDIRPLPATPPGQYFCPNPSGYFPAVSVCNEPWALTQDTSPPVRNNG